MAQGRRSGQLWPQEAFTLHLPCGMMIMMLIMIIMIIMMTIMNITCPVSDHDDDKEGHGADQ